MADHVYLSIWLRGFTVHNMLRHFERALERFPFSRLTPQATLRIYAIELQEPPLLERRFDEDATPPAVIEAAREFTNDDCAYQLECFWDLWQYEESWNLRPATVSLTCFAPFFPSDLGEQLLIDLGHEELYLPRPEPGSATPIRSNIRSLLRLVEELEEVLPVAKRMLWSESGENLAERLQAAVENEPSPEE